MFPCSTKIHNDTNNVLVKMGSLLVLRFSDFSLKTELEIDKLLFNRNKLGIYLV